MSRPTSTSLLLTCSLLAAVILTGCSRDPNVRKQKYFDSGEKYFADGKFREAAIQFSNAIQVDPRFAQAHYKLGETYIRLRDGQRAVGELARSVDLAPDNYQARADLANLYVSGRDLADAKPQLDALREKQPNSPDTHEAWANYDAAQNRLSEAMQEMQLAIAEDPSRSESYLLLAVIEMNSSLFDAAEKNFKKAVETGPKAVNSQLALGGFYQTRNRLPEAEQQYRNAITVAPHSPDPRSALVRLLMREGKRDEAIAFLIQTKKDLPDNPEGYRMLGDFYFATGDLDHATTEYASLYAAHPKDLQAKKNYIQLLILKSRLDDATKLDDEILKTNPHDVEALVFKAEVHIHNNDSAGAIESLNAALKNDPDNAVAHYQLGVALTQQHDDTRAESEWREAVHLRPELTEAQRSLAGLELRRGDVDAVLQTAQQIVDAQPDSADGYLLKAIAEIAGKKFADAAQDAQKAMQLAPANPAAYVEMGNVNLAQKNFSEAEKFYQQALDKDPSSADGLSGLMNTFFAAKQYDKALAAAQTQIAKSPNNSNFYDLLGTALFNGKKDYPAAETALRKAVELDKTNIDAVEKLGKVEIQQQHSADQALALYQQSIKDNPREVVLYILSGELYEGKKDWDHAKGMYQQALTITPDQALASNNLASVMLDQGGNLDVAMGLAQAARRGMPDSPNAADTLGWAYYHKGVYQSAIAQFQEALRLAAKRGDPEDADIHFHLGLAYEKDNKTALARQQLEKAVKIRPDHADARKALSELHG